MQVAKLKVLKANHVAQQYEMQDKSLKFYPRKIAETKLYIEALSADLPILQEHSVKDDTFSITIQGKQYTERKEAGQAIINICTTIDDPEKTVELGEYRGFPMTLHFDRSKFKVTMKQNLTYTAELSDDPVGSITRINNALEKIPDNLKGQQERLTTLENALENAKEEAERPFPKEDELREKSERLNQLNAELGDHRSSFDSERDDDNIDDPDLEDMEPPAQREEKPSIRQQIRSFVPPPRVAAARAPEVER